MYKFWIKSKFALWSWGQKLSLLSEGYYTLILIVSLNYKGGYRPFTLSLIRVRDHINYLKLSWTNLINQCRTFTWSVKSIWFKQKNRPFFTFQMVFQLKTKNACKCIKDRVKVFPPWSPAAHLEIKYFNRSLNK